MKMKIFAKRFGKFINLVIGGRPKTIETSSDIEMNKLIELVRLASKGDIGSIEELDRRVNVEDGSNVSLEVQEIKELVDQMVTQIEGDKELIKVVEEQHNLLESTNFFEIKDNNVYLKGSKSEIPYMLVEKMVQELNAGNSLDKYIKFWKLTLLNPNPEARRGLYSFIKNQKLFLHDSGFFIAFRQLVLKTEHRGFDEKIEELYYKVKKQKKSPKNYYIYCDKETEEFVAKPKGWVNKTNNLTLVSNNLNDAFKPSNKGSNNTYTDNYTRTMEIQIGRPVSTPRSKCNHNSNVGCSFGLHVGSQEFVYNGSFGDTIVAVLVNPQNVVSVPYFDAHKMRVCEYFPFKVLSKEELLNFNSQTNVDEYITDHLMKHETKLNEALQVIDTLTKKERLEFSADYFVDKDTLVENEDMLVLKQHELTESKKKVAKLLQDDVSQALDFGEIKNILSMRIA